MKIFEYKKEIENSFLSFKATIDGENENIIWNPEEEKIDDGWIIKLNISSEKKPFAVKNVLITAKVPIIDIHGISIPGKVNNPYLFILPWHIEEDTSLYREFPFLSFINRKGENKFALGIKDPTLGFKISGGIIEKTEEFELDISSITKHRGNSFELEVFISTQQKHWFELSQLYSNWVNPEQDKLPDFMYDPVYCSWYAFYQELDQKYLESVVEEAHNLGFKIFILDDGWFTDDTNRGYWYTGDWEVYEGKFPNFKDHVKKIHDIGMKYVLWIAPFMFGKKSKNYDSLSKYSVNSRDNLGFENLCPQSNFTKKRIINVLKELLIKYDLDGFKLDFIDDLPTKPCSNESHEHFTYNPSKGVKEILKNIKEELET
ncbi:MAG TPA: hypothetical protein ENF81_01070, partial [Thermotogaceae bacterium]|nr:hypothetical protein [Thermotogaceae bacterium]